MEKLSPHIEAETNLQPLWLIGDLDGNYLDFKTHLARLRAVPMDRSWVIWSLSQTNEPIWTGKNMRIINSGDVLADRYMGGFQIMEYGSKLRVEAEKEWWSIDFLTGNHDDRMIGFLMGKWGEFISDDLRWSINPITRKADHIGIDELLVFGSKRTEILRNMRNDPRWKMLLNEICKMKIFMYGWNALHFHTPPSKLMLDTLYQTYKNKGENLDNVIDTINFNWQQTIRGGFFDPNKESYADRSKIHYTILSSTFLHPLNWTEVSIRKRFKGNTDRYAHNITPENHPFYEILKQKYNIHRIYHGHTDDVPDVDGIEFIGINRQAIYISPAMVTQKLLNSVKQTIDGLLG